MSLDPSQVSQVTAFVQEVAQVAEFNELLALRDPGRFIVQGFGGTFPNAVQCLAMMLGLRFRIERVDVVEVELKG